jgi:hypothetical protein
MKSGYSDGPVIKSIDQMLNTVEGGCATLCVCVCVCVSVCVCKRDTETQRFGI